MHESEVINLKQEPRGCRWIEGDPRERNWTFCQRPVEEPERVWCAHHRVRVFRDYEAEQARAA